MARIKFRFKAIIFDLIYILCLFLFLYFLWFLCLIVLFSISHGGFNNFEIELHTPLWWGIWLYVSSDFINPGLQTWKNDCTRRYIFQRSRITPLYLILAARLIRFLCSNQAKGKRCSIFLLKTNQCRKLRLLKMLVTDLLSHFLARKTFEQVT